MGDRGRESAQERGLTDVSALPERLSPPEDLSDEQKSVWVELVNSQPVDWFKAEHREAMANYCRWVVRHRRTCEELEGDFDTREPDDLKRMKALEDIASKQNSAIEALRRSMRMTHQSQYDTQKAARAKNGKQSRSLKNDY